MIFCVTGKMAAGKNAVSDYFEKKGFVSIDADKVVHQILLEKDFQEKVISTFEDFAKSKNIELRNSDGTLNRRNLGALIFADKKLLSLQESIVLPQVDKRIVEFINSNKDKNLIINATVLYKIPCVKLCNAIIFVDAPILIRLKRAKKRDGIKIIQIIQRFWSQRNLFSKYKKANADIYRIKNSDSLNILQEKIDNLLEKLK